MDSLLSQMRSRPSLFALAGTMGATIVAFCGYSLYKMNGDQELVYDSRRDPFPYLRPREQPHFMLTKVSQREESERHYDLLDILNGKYRGASCQWVSEENRVLPSVEKEKFISSRREKMLVTPPLDADDPKLAVLDRSPLFPLLVLMSRNGEGPPPREHRVLADLLFRLDPKFFKGVFIPSVEAAPVDSMLLKRIYLCIMAYVRDVLGEDWSDLPLPDFPKAIRGNAEEMDRFLLLMILTFTSKATLRMEFEGLLSSFKGNSDRVRSDLQMMHKVRRRLGQSPGGNALAKLAKDQVNRRQVEESPPDYQVEYCSLQLLHDVVSQEAEALGNQLTLSEREKAAAYQSLEQAKLEMQHLRHEIAILREDKERAAASDDLVLANARKHMELSNYQSDANRVLDQVGSLTNPIAGISEIPAQLTNLIERQSELQELSTHLERELSCAKHTIAELQSLLEESEGRLISIVAEEQTRCDGLNVAHQELVQKHERLQSLHTALMAEQDVTKSELQKAAAERDDLVRQVSHLGNVVASLEHAKAEALSAQQAEHRALEQMLDAQISYWQTQYQRVVASCQSVKVDMQEASAEARCLTDKLDAEIAQKSQTMKQNEMLVAKVTNMKSQLRELKSSLKTARLENKELESRNIAGSKTIDRLDAALKELESAKLDLHGEVGALQAQITLLQGASRSAQEGHALERAELEEALCGSCTELVQLRDQSAHYQEEMGRLQAELVKERESSLDGQRQKAEFSRLATQHGELRDQVNSLIEELALERHHSETFKYDLESARSSLQAAQKQLIDRDSNVSRLEQELMDAWGARNFLEQSVSQARSAKWDSCQKWAKWLNNLLREAGQIRKDLDCLAAMASHPVLAADLWKRVASLQTALQEHQTCDTGIETDVEDVSEARAIEARVERTGRSMRAEHDSVLTYIHQLGSQFYQQSFFSSH